MYNMIRRQKPVTTTSLLGSKYQEITAIKKIYLETLRIIAFTCVIFNHTGDYGFNIFTRTDSLLLKVISIMLSNTAKIGVPLFLMISGALLIPKKESLKDLLIRRVLKMAVILTAASFIYYIRLYIMHPEYGFSIKYFFTLINGQPFITPFWFLYVYIAFLLMLPFLRRLALSLTKREYDYLMLLCLIFNFVLYFVNRLLGSDNYLSLPILSLGVIYPLTGYYIDAVFNPSRIMGRFGNIVLLRSDRNIPVTIMVLLINGISCAGLTYNDFLKSGEWTYKYIEGMIFIPAFCIFCLVRELEKKRPLKDRARRIVSHVGGCIFIVYLLEEILRDDICMNIYRYGENICPLLLLFIPYALALYALGIAAASLIKLIPGIKKWL